jgi:hypothetical protein
VIFFTAVCSSLLIKIRTGKATNYMQQAAAKKGKEE